MLSEEIGEALAAKYDDLKNIIAGYGSLAVAFSGGVDSTFLLRTVHDVLGNSAIAITARSCSFPARELNEAREYCDANGIRHYMVDSEELEIDGFAQNPPNRCYLCKKELFTKMRETAAEQGVAFIAEGSNIDDEGDYRPGLIAVAEMEVKSPLREAGLSKNEIRAVSKALGLKTWDKQSFACLSSRFAYGETINVDKLQRVERAEQLLLDLGFNQVRVRIHGESGDLARIEVDSTQVKEVLSDECRETIQKGFREIGFVYTALDLAGYRTGSMNENLP